MNKYTVVRLGPDEYITQSNLEAEIFGFTSNNGLVITKDGNKIPIVTPFAVDSGCEIEVKYKENGIGKVKYLSSTPRRKYYMFLMWYIISLEILSILFIIYEVSLGNYGSEDSRSVQLLPSVIGTWLTLNIVFFRNAKTFTTRIITIFSYCLLVFCTIRFVTYLSVLIS